MQLRHALAGSVITPSKSTPWLPPRTGTRGTRRSKHRTVDKGYLCQPKMTASFGLLTSHSPTLEPDTARMVGTSPGTDPSAVVTPLDQDALALILADRIAGAIIELGRAQRLVDRNLLRASIGQLPLSFISRP
jgi:hypothetical protein